MPQDQNAPPVVDPQAPLPGVEPEAPAVDPKPEPTFSQAQVEEIISKAEARARAAAIEEFKKQQAAEAEPASVADEPSVVDPPKPKEENLLLQSQLEAERKAKAELESKLEAREAESLKNATMDKIADLLAPDKRALSDPAAQRAMVAEIYASKAFTFEDGKISHPDLTADPSQVITDFLAQRPWYQTKLPEGSGAAPASTGITPGTSDQSKRFDSSKFMDGHDALDAALAYDRQNAKG
jgi:hypothetical protein